MINIINNIFIESSLVYELLNAMFRVQCQEYIIPEKLKNKEYISQDVLQWVDKVKAPRFFRYC